MSQEPRVSERSQQQNDTDPYSQHQHPPLDQPDPEVAPTSSDASASGNPNPAFQDALQRARQIASKIKPGPDAPGQSLKRPLGGPLSHLDGPQLKRSMDGSAPAPAGLGVPAGAGGPGGGEQPSSEMITVPDKMVGLIIGRGGEQITRLQAESGCKIQMAQDSQGMPDRQCTLTGTPAAIAQAKESITRIIANEGAGPRGGGGGGGMGGGPMGAGGGFYEQMCPGHKVGLIIGKGGEMIKQLQEQSGAKIVIIQESAEAANEKPLRITGTPEAVEIAKQLVNDILSQSDDRDMGGFGGRGRGRGGFRGARGGGFPPRGGRGGGRGGFGGNQWGGAGGGDYGPQSTDYVQVPSNKCGLIIGKGGETIKSINQNSGASCEIDKNAPPDARDKNFIIRGSPESVARAKEMILEKLGMGAGGGYGGGGQYGGGNSWGGSQSTGYPGGYGGENAAPGGAPGGQADYSAQWAEYYRSMGMIKEAEAIEASRGSGGAAPAPANPASAAPAANGNGGTDYSAQWAEYYRSIGKVKEAEQIEAQMKQKNGGGAPGAPGAGSGYPQQQPYHQYYGN